MKRLVILTILLVGAISISGCANGPLKRLRRGSQCGTTSSCQCGVDTNATYYGSTDFGSSSCPTCGTATPSYEYYEAPTVPAPIGTIPAPGPGQ